MTDPVNRLHPREEGRERAIDGLLRTRLGSVDPDVCSRVMEELQRAQGGVSVGGGGHWGWLRWEWLAAAAAVLVVAGVGLYLGSGVPDFREMPLGNISSVEGAVWKGNGRELPPQPARAGDPVCLGGQWITDPGASLEWIYAREATRVGMMSGSECRIDGEREIHLARGELKASVAKQPEGRRFVVTTPLARVEVKGTELAVRTDSSTSVVDVTEGVVGLSTLDRTSSMDVLAGERGEVVQGRPVAKYALAISQRSVAAKDRWVIFQDDFEHDLSKWLLGTSKGTTDERVWIDPSMPPPEKLIGIRRGNVRGKTSNVLAISAGEGLNPFAQMRLPVEVEDYDVEYDVCIPKGREARVRFMATPSGVPLEDILGKPDNFVFESDRWYHQRIELRCSRDDSGKEPLHEIRRFLDGELISHFRYRGAGPGLGVAIIQGAVLIDNVVAWSIQDQSETGGLWGWAHAYYKAHDEWILNRERFKDGELLAAIPAGRVPPGKGEIEGGRVETTRARMKDGSEGDCLLIESRSLSYSGVTFLAPMNLPRSFAVEIDIKPLASLPPPGHQTVPTPILFDAYRTPADGGPSWARLDCLPSQATVLAQRETTVHSVITIGRWSVYRVDYFRVGMTPEGEAIYETRYPGPDGAEVRLSGKIRPSFSIAACASRILVGEIRFRRLEATTDPRALK